MLPNAAVDNRIASQILPHRKVGPDVAHGPVDNFERLLSGAEEQYAAVTETGVKEELKFLVELRRNDLERYLKEHPEARKRESV
jgi:hypothetical protein